MWLNPRLVVRRPKIEIHRCDYLAFPGALASRGV
jgi:hypothetical protein